MGSRPSTSRADVVLDCFGIMHEPDQRSAFARRAQVTAPAVCCCLQYHSIATIVEQGQWNALRHGHFAYYSLTTLKQLARRGGNEHCRGMGVRPLRRHGAARRGPRQRPSPMSRASGSSRWRDRSAGDHEHTVARLQARADEHARSLRDWLLATSRCRPFSSRVRGGVARGGPVQPRGISIRDCWRPSPMPRPPNRAGGCLGPTFRSCRRRN